MPNALPVIRKYTPEPEPKLYENKNMQKLYCFSLILQTLFSLFFKISLPTVQKCFEALQTLKCAVDLSGYRFLDLPAPLLTSTLLSWGNNFVFATKNT